MVIAALTHSSLVLLSDLSPLVTTVDTLQLQPTVTNDSFWGCFGSVQVTEKGELVTLSFAQSSQSSNMDLYSCTL